MFPWLHEIDAISRTIIHAKLTDAVKEFGVSKVTQFHAVNADLCAGLGANVPEGLEPFGELSGFANFEHA